MHYQVFLCFWLSSWLMKNLIHNRNKTTQCWLITPSSTKFINVKSNKTIGFSFANGESQGSLAFSVFKTFMQRFQVTLNCMVFEKHFNCAGTQQYYLFLQTYKQAVFPTPLGPVNITFLWVFKFSSTI